MPKRTFIYGRFAAPPFKIDLVLTFLCVGDGPPFRHQRASLHIGTCGALLRAAREGKVIAAGQIARVSTSGKAAS
jgi:hypothetical protein